MVSRAADIILLLKMGVTDNRSSSNFFLYVCVSSKKVVRPPQPVQDKVWTELNVKQHLLRDGIVV